MQSNGLAVPTRIRLCPSICSSPATTIPRRSGRTSSRIRESVPSSACSKTSETGRRFPTSSSRSTRSSKASGRFASAVYVTTAATPEEVHRWAAELQPDEYVGEADAIGPWLGGGKPPGAPDVPEGHRVVTLYWDKGVR